MSQTNHYATPTYAVIIILQNYPFLCNLVEIKNYTWFKHSHDLLSNIKAISKNDCFRLLIVNWKHFKQARNQLVTPGGAKSVLRGDQIFKTISIGFELCPFFQGGEKFFLRF